MSYSISKPQAKQAAKHIVISIITFLFIVTLPVTIVVVLLTYGFRCLLEIYVKYFKKEFGRIVTIRSTIFALDAPDETRRTSSSLILSIVFKGRIEFDKFKEDIRKKAMEKDCDRKYKYPELQQTLRFYFGYPFWKWDKEFNIDNHVVAGYDNSDTLDEEGLNTLTAKLCRTHFNNERSPWMVYLIPEYETKGTDSDSDPKCIVIVHFSHFLADGQTIVHLVSQAAKVKIKTVQFTENWRTRYLRYLNTALCLILAPYELMLATYECSDKNILELPKNTDSNSVVVRISEPIPVSLIKELKNKLNANFESVLFTAYTGGLRKLMLANKLEIPDVVHSIIPLKIHAHRDKLRNAMKYGLVSMPVGIEDVESRLKYIEAQLIKMKLSRLPSQLYYLSVGVGVFPTALFRKAMMTIRQTGIVSNFVIPFKKMSYHEHEILEGSFASGIHYGQTWFVITCLTFRGYLKIQTNFIETTSLTAGKDVFHDAVINELQHLADNLLV